MRRTPESAQEEPPHAPRSTRQEERPQRQQCCPQAPASTHDARLQDFRPCGPHAPTSPTKERPQASASAHEHRPQDFRPQRPQASTKTAHQDSPPREAQREPTAPSSVLEVSAHDEMPFLQSKPKLADAGRGGQHEACTIKMCARGAYPDTCVVTPTCKRELYVQGLLCFLLFHVSLLLFPDASCFFQLFGRPQKQEAPQGIC